MSATKKSLLVALVLALVSALLLWFAMEQKAERPPLSEKCAEGKKRLPPECPGGEQTNPNEDPETAVEPTRPPTVADERPNIIVMLVDDMRVEDLAYMPKLRQYMADKGIYYPNMISPNPVCCPARGSLVSAQYTHNNGVLTNAGFYGGMDALKHPDNTVPVWLQQAGYNTAFFGKYMNGYGDARTEAIPAGWDWWDATGRGTYAFTKFQFANNGEPEWFENDYITTRLRERSDERIRVFAEERATSGEPFFIFDSYVAPHGAIGADKELVREVGRGPIPDVQYRDLYLDQLNPSFEKPSYNAAIKNYPVKGYMREMKKRGVEEMQKKFLLRIQSLASVDDAVEQTVATLKETGQYDNTVLFFLSDNGFLLGEHMKYGKQLIQHESVRVPLVVSGPGFEGGQSSERWATTVDVATTVLDLARAKPGLPIDGRSLVGSSSRDPKPSTAVVVENGNAKARSRRDDKWNYQGLLMGLRYSYADWTTNGGGEELYDNERDPYQLVNVANDPRYAPVLAAARKELAKLGACSGPESCESKRDSWPEPLKDEPRRKNG